jgi:endoglucanase Acf2
VGKGFLLTVAPDGIPIAVDKRGRPVKPKVTDDFAQAPITSKWWSSLIWQYDPQNPHSYNLYAHPLVLRARAAGLGLSYPTKPAIAKREYMYPFSQDLLIGLEGLLSPDTRVASYSDWAVTAEWRSPSSENRLRATLGHGLPFVYLTKQGPAAASITVAAEKAGGLEIWSGEGGGPVLGVTVGGHHYGIFGPSRSTWTRKSATFSSDLAGKDYFSVAILPDRRPATLELFRQHAYAFVEDTRVSWSYDAPTATLSTRFAVKTTLKEQGQTDGRQLSEAPLLALYRHQWLHTKEALSPHAYVSPRGPMKLLEGSQFTTRMTFGGVLPSLPQVPADASSYDVDDLRGYVDQVYRADPLFPPGLGPKRDHDAYWTGKSLGKLASVAQIADAIGYRKARDHLLQAIKNELQAWFDGGDPRMLYYDRTWRSVIALPPSYDSSAQLNDHHFHYGYFVVAAAVVARYDPAWAQRWREPIEVLIRDAASWQRDDRDFPFLRHMDPYAGHSWANGPAQYEEGNNQEASSEDINFSNGVLLWGAFTGNREIRDLGIFLHATQSVATEQYWFDVDESVFPQGFDHPAAGMIWGAGAKYDTWFDQNPIMVHGINFLPFTGGSLYLGRRSDYVARTYREILRRSGGKAFTWRDYLLMYLALADGRKAAKLFEEDRYFLPEFGNSMALTYSWIHTLAALGRVKPQVTADLPIYAVFQKAEVRTYAAFNPAAQSRTVTFSDGYKLSVPPRQLAHGQQTTSP